MWTHVVFLLLGLPLQKSVSQSVFTHGNGTAGGSREKDPKAPGKHALPFWNGGKLDRWEVLTIIPLSNQVPHKLLTHRGSQAQPFDHACQLGSSYGVPQENGGAGANPQDF